MNRKSFVSSALLVSLSLWLGASTTGQGATNTRPIAVSDGVYAVVQGSMFSVTAPGVLANDSDADGEPLTTVLTSGTTQGTLSLARDGSFSYRAPSDYSGEDDFSYVANDGHTVSLRALAKIKVVPVSGLPSINIVSPRTGTTMSAGNLNVIASASDSDGTVANVQFFVNDVLFTNVAIAPFCFVMNNASAGTYRLTAIATDSDGLNATSAPVVIEVITNAVVFAGPVAFNKESGAFEQNIAVSNGTSEIWVSGARLWIYNLDGTMGVLNPSGLSGGVPYLDNTDALPPGGTQTFTVQYVVPDVQSLPAPTLVAVPLPANRSMQMPQITSIMPASDEIIEVKFTSQPGNIYFLQYSQDFVHWKTDSVAVVGNGASTTASQRRTGQNCFYRVLRVL